MEDRKIRMKKEEELVEGGRRGFGYSEIVTEERGDTGRQNGDRREFKALKDRTWKEKGKGRVEGRRRALGKI